MKVNRLVTILTIIAIATAVASQAEREQPDSDIEAVSHFLIKIINKYDESGAGAIPVKKYPYFLSEVFLTGHSMTNEQPNVSQSTSNLLLEATTAFTGKYNTTEVGIQQFYTDLLKDFTLFLTENNDKYETLLDTFFADAPERTEIKEEGNKEEQLQL